MHDDDDGDDDDDDDEDVPNDDMSCMYVGVFVTTLNKRMIKRATLKR